MFPKEKNYSRSRAASHIQFHVLQNSNAFIKHMHLLPFTDEDKYKIQKQVVEGTSFSHPLPHSFLDAKHFHFFLTMATVSPMFLISASPCPCLSSFILILDLKFSWESQTLLVLYLLSQLLLAFPFFFFSKTSYTFPVMKLLLFSLSFEGSSGPYVWTNNSTFLSLNFFIC